MLNRRRFVKSTAAAGLAAALPIPARATPHSFHLNYAPHAGHFEQSAGPAIVDQIDFAADAGFTAWEDNDMRGRDIPEQEEIAAALARNGMQMGVFVAADIAWEEPGMTTGDEASRSRFLSDIRGSIDVAKHCFSIPLRDKGVARERRFGFQWIARLCRMMCGGSHIWPRILQSIPISSSGLSN